MEEEKDETASEGQPPADSEEQSRRGTEPLVVTASLAEGDRPPAAERPTLVPEAPAPVLSEEMALPSGVAGPSGERPAAVSDPLLAVRPRRDPFEEVEDVLRRAAEARGGEPVMGGKPLPRSSPADPMAAAREALARAAEARGGLPSAGPRDEPKRLPTRRRSVEEVLEAAAATRELAMKGRANAAREAAARKELARIRAAMGAGPQLGAEEAEDSEEAPSETLATRKRRL